ncbi:hypothetical protein BH09CHL1_BH09CHL1_25270 [soil metagenome]
MGTASRIRYRLAGAAVAALLMVSPILSNQAFAAQGSSDIDPDAAQALLSDAQDLAEGVDPLIDDDAFEVEQTEDSVAGTFVTEEGDDIADFYLEYTVEAPIDGADEPFDFGTVFRYSDSDNDDAEYRLIFVSDVGSGPGWDFIYGPDEQDVLSDTLDEDVFEVADGSTYDIALAVIGDEAAFSVNGEPLALLDVSEFSDLGRVILGTGFYNSTTVDARDVEFSNINLYVLDDADSNGNGTEEATEEATEEGGNGETEGRGEEETPTEEATEEATEETTGEGDAYVSPEYGFSLTYDDSWTITNEESSGQDFADIGLDNVDYVVLKNDDSSVTLFSGETTNTPEECVQHDIGYFEGSDQTQYTFFSIAKSSDDEDLQGETADGGYYTVIWVTDNGTDDAPLDPGVDTTIYIECRPIVDGESMILIEHYAADANYNDQIAAREELLSGLDISGSNTNDDPTEEADETPTEEADETPTEEADETPEVDESPTEEATGDDLTVTLDAVGTSDVEGEAVISSSGTSRSTIDVVAPGAPEGALVIVQEGSCDDLSGAADFDAGSIDENGESSDRIRITPDELDGNYALTIVDAETEDYAEPLACGDIG